jgi:RNA processing factor Prp31
MKKECKSSEWDIRLKSRKKPIPMAIGIKPGTEMSEKVNIMHVDIQEETDEESETIDLNLVLENENNNQIEFALKKKSKTKFKASGDLTEKVNVLHVDFIEETTEDSLTETMKMKLQKNDNELLALAVKKKKTKFKAGADLTDKVNVVAIDWIEEIDENSEEFTFFIKLKSNFCTKDENQELDSQISA